MSAKIVGMSTSATQCKRSRENTRATAHNDMFGLVARLCEIQVVREEVFLIGGSQANLQVEFTPSFLRDSEWRVLES